MSAIIVIGIYSALVIFTNAAIWLPKARKAWGKSGVIATIVFDIILVILIIVIVHLKATIVI